jgi:hypothetical protein
LSFRLRHVPLTLALAGDLGFGALCLAFPV